MCSLDCDQMQSSEMSNLLRGRIWAAKLLRKVWTTNFEIREAFNKKKTLKVVELSTKGGGCQPHFHTKKLEKKMDIFSLVHNGLVHPEKPLS